MQKQLQKRTLLVIFVLFGLSGKGATMQLQNEHLTLHFDAQTGILADITTAAGTRITPRPSCQYNIQAKDNSWLFSPVELPFKVEKHSLTTFAGGQELTMVMSCPGWQLEVFCRLFAGEKIFSRRVAWTRLDDVPVDITIFRFALEGLVVGQAAECSVIYPSYWPPQDFPLVGSQTRRYTTPGRNHIPGAILYNSALRCGIGVSMQTTKSDYAIYTDTGDGVANVQTDFNIRACMQKGDRLDSGEELVTLVEDCPLNDALASLGRAWTLNGFTCRTRPQWTGGAVLYSAFVQGTTASRWVDIGGFDNFRQVVLPHLKSIGVDILWFNPFNTGRYGVYSYYDFEDGIGSEDDLAALCADAQKLGIRVLMDLIPHGPKPKHPYGEKLLAEHPEWFSRDADGAPKIWWGSYALDYASPGWQNEMMTLATHFISRCGIDGWRVDCARYSPDNERPTDGRIPSQSGTEGAITLMKRVHQAMEQTKPESILLGETSTVSHLSQMEYIYDTIIGGYVFPQLSRSTPEEWVPQLKLYLDRDEAALPVDYALGLMRYCENHDNAPAIRRYGSGHRDALLATCFLLPGLPLISQDGDVGAGTLIRTLSAIRKRPEFARGKAVYLPTGSSDPAVLTFTRIVPEQFSAVAINFSGQVKQLELQLPPECQDRTLHMREICSDALAICNGKTIRSELPPYATQVFAFAVPQPALPPAPDNKKPADIPTVDPDLVGQIIRTDFWTAQSVDGFLVSLVDATGRNVLHKMHMVSPAETVRDGKHVDYTQNITLQRVGRASDEVSEYIFEGAWPNGARLRSVYTTGDGSPDIRVRLEVTPAANGEQPALELTFGDDTDEWYVAALEGALRDSHSVRHPRGDEMALIEKDLWLRVVRITHLVQKSGMLWQADAQPLDPRHGQISVRKGDRWTGIRFSQEDQALLGDIFLRENGSLAQGLTLRLHPKGHVIEFTIRADDPPQVVPGITAGFGWDLKSDGSSHRFSNDHFQLRVNRHAGGGVAALLGKSGSPLLLNASIYSNDGFFTPSYDPEHSRELQCFGTSKNNIEAGMALTNNVEELALRFSGELKRNDSKQGFSALPKVAYAVEYRLDDSPRIRFNASVTPQPRPERRGSLVWECPLARDITDIDIQTTSGSQRFTIATQKDDEQFWTTTRDALADVRSLTFIHRDGQQRWTITNIDHRQIASLSLFRDQRGNTAFRVAFFAAEVCDQLTTRSFACDLVVE